MCSFSQICKTYLIKQPRTFFELKSAYPQVPLHRKDMSFTAFEVNGRLFEFTSLPFGVTNALAAFQREMTAFVRRQNLKRTHPYLDYVIIGGRSEEEHQEKLKNFSKAAETEGLTLIKAKCVFGCKTVPMLGHIVGAGSNCTDQTRKTFWSNWPHSPVLVVAKAIVQSCWKLDPELSDAVPDDVSRAYTNCKADMSSQSQLKIPRKVLQTLLYNEAALQVFCDASEKAYGACVYLVSVKDDIVSSPLFSSKCKVAPIKPSTLPGPELLAIHTGAKLATAVKGHYQNQSTHCTSLCCTQTQQSPSHGSRQTLVDDIRLCQTACFKFSQCSQQLNSFTYPQRKTQQICAHVDC